AEDGIRDGHVTGVQTCALPISDALAVLVQGGLKFVHANRCRGRDRIDAGESRRAAIQHHDISHRSRYAGLPSVYGYVKDALTRRRGDAGVRSLVHYGHQRHTCLSNQDLDVVRRSGTGVAIAAGIGYGDVGLSDFVRSSVDKWK